MTARGVSFLQAVWLLARNGLADRCAHLALVAVSDDASGHLYVCPSIEDVVIHRECWLYGMARRCVLHILTDGCTF